MPTTISWLWTSTAWNMVSSWCFSIWLWLHWCYQKCFPRLTETRHVEVHYPRSVPLYPSTKWCRKSFLRKISRFNFSCLSGKSKWTINHWLPITRRHKNWLKIFRVILADPSHTIISLVKHTLLASPHLGAALNLDQVFLLSSFAHLRYQPFFKN